MYDYYLDPNACLYGLHNGSAPLHVMFNQADSTIMITNNTFKHQYDLMWVAKTIDMNGKETSLGQAFAEIGPSTTRMITPINNSIRELAKKEGVFLSLRLLNLDKEIVSDNLYWLPDSEGNYSGLNTIPKAEIGIKTRQVAKGKVEVTLSNPAKNPVAFFNRLSLVDPKTKKRILPVFYDDNYISVLPGENKTVVMDYTPSSQEMPLVSLEGWNVKEQFIEIK